jgi:hypothetical protein
VSERTLLLGARVVDMARRRSRSELDWTAAGAPGYLSPRCLRTVHKGVMLFDALPEGVAKSAP